MLLSNLSNDLHVLLLKYLLPDPAENSAGPKWDLNLEFLVRGIWSSISWGEGGEGVS